MATPLTAAQQQQAHQAVQALQKQDFATAARLFDRLGKVVLEHADLARAAGFAHINLQNMQLGINYLQASLGVDDNQPDVHATIGDILVELGDANTALRHLEKALARRSDEARLHHLKGLALLRLERFEESLASMRQALALAPDDMPAKLGEARALTELGRFEEAEKALQSLLDVNPDNAAVHFRYARLREKQLRYDDALTLLEKAADLGDSTPEICEALGLVELARGNPDKAIAAFQRGLDTDPGNAVLLAQQSLLRFEMGDEDAFASYERAVAASKSPVPRAEYVLRLLHSGDLAKAGEQLEIYARDFGRDALWASRQARLLAERQDFAAMKALLADAPIEDQGLMTLMVQALMGLGEYEDAERLIMSLLYRDRRDQYLLALLSTCYRATKPDAYANLVDYDKLVRRVELAVPTGYDNLPAFNAALAERLEALHITRQNPLEQSVRGGTQTPGNILLQPDPVIQSLREAIFATLKREFNTDFFAGIGEDNPVNVARGRELALQAAWSIRVTQGGYHKSHVHNRGWYSSAYYVSVPEEILPQNAVDDAGALVFGEPDVSTPDEFGADRVLPPEEGILTLFPSFVWHGTRPYKSEAPRVVVAFDAVPTAE